MGDPRQPRTDLIDGKQVASEDMKVIGTTVGDHLKKLMKDHNLDIKQLSELSKVYEESIVQISEGQRMISVGEAKKLARVLHVSPQDIILAGKH